MALTVAFAAGTSAAGEVFYGAGLFGGTQWHDDPIWYVSEHHDWRDFSVRPILGLHKTDRWDLWLEGNLTYVDLEEEQDSVELGATAMTSYDFASGTNWGLFGEIGAGLGWMSDTPNKRVLGTGIIGFFDYGLGLRIKTEGGAVVRLGPRFHHRSGVFRDDYGMNTYGVMVSITN